MNVVHISPLLCKGCGYCVKFCPKEILEMGTVRSRKGHFNPFVTDAEKCIGCAICATMCPDAAIEGEKGEKDG